MRPRVDHDDLGDGETIEIRSNERPGAMRSAGPTHVYRVEPKPEPEWDFETWMLNTIAALALGSALGLLVGGLVSAVVAVIR
ncbi:hypothetical protein [Bosea sp. (in: a-proteobacteria)]|uniref:hypothetical protein n=1 Tax=Bosea sp. (in: a-proteobacteria) TaxID=1871050 RepID=UPI002735F977|nr:hypothetical protein [Bosea sp. (in: a-proteobacteria)]MDP3408092.1 hypothetical protein [Bosea sp. (in: a-proteobacteria)]